MFFFIPDLFTSRRVLTSPDLEFYLVYGRLVNLLFYILRVSSSFPFLLRSLERQGHRNVQEEVETKIHIRIK